MSVLERKVKRWVIQLIIQMSTSFTALLLFLGRIFRTPSSVRKRFLLKDLSEVARILHPSVRIFRKRVWLESFSSDSWRRLKASWIISFLSFFSKISSCNYLIIRSFSSTFDYCVWCQDSYPIFFSLTFYGCCRLFITEVMLILFWWKLFPGLALGVSLFSMPARGAPSFFS